MAHLKRQYRIHLLPPTHKDYGRDLPIEDDEQEQPEILRTTPFDPAINDMFIVEWTGWDHDQIRRQPDAWLRKILLARNVNNQIQNELMDPEAGKRAEPKRKIGADELAAGRDRYPEASDEALAELYEG